MARPAANLTAHFAPTPVSAAPGSAGREEAIWRPTTSRRLGPTSARQHRLAGKLVMHFVIMGSPLRGTEGSNPSPSQRRVACEPVFFGMPKRRKTTAGFTRCGKKFRPERVAARPGFDRIPAVQHQHLYEIKSSLILQPGPAALTDGLAELQRIIEQWATRR